MRLEIFLVLAAAFVAQGLEDHTNLDFFMALGEMEDTLRNESFNFEKCYLHVKDRHEKVINKFLAAVTDLKPKIHEILKAHTDPMNYGSHATKLLIKLGLNMGTYPKKILDFVREKKYIDAADLVFTQRKEVEHENSTFDSWMDKIKRNYPHLVKIVYELMDKIRDETIKEGRKVAIDYTKCVENTKCSPNAGYQIIY